MDWLKRIFSRLPSSAPTPSPVRAHSVGRAPEASDHPRTEEAPEPGVIKIKRRFGKGIILRIEAESLRGIDLNSRDLSEAVFDDMDLSGANLAGCLLMNASFRNARLENASLARAITQQATHVQGASFYGANLTNASLTRAKMEHTQFDSANLENADFTGAHLGCTFRNAKLKNANFCGADLTRSTLTRILEPIRYDEATKWPERFSPNQIGKPGFQGKCPTCGVPCTLVPAPFSEYVKLYRCPQRHLVGVQCPSCKEDILMWVADLDFTVHTECKNCAHASTGIPKDWWHRNMAKSR